MSTQERLPPNFARLDTALRSIGYTFEAAVADIVDNSIDARAKHVLVRVIVTPEGHLDLAIWDDGCGMDDRILKEAMRFGADVSQEIARLGKFGLGLKLASLSQARELHVVSSANGSHFGRAWLEQGITEGFTSTVYDASECKEVLSQTVPDRRRQGSYTLVWWSRLYRIGQHHGDAQEHAQKLMRRLEDYLSLAFHRFLSGRSPKLKLTLDIFDSGSKKAGIPVDLDPLDPFAYDQSGQAGFPASMLLDGTYHDRITIKAHIWPPNSTAPEYKLPGGTNSRQGFYFYRNDRLIQGGGWSGIREAEPHSSLARLEVDLAPEVDVEVNLDIKKVEISLPRDLAGAIQRAHTTSGVDFKKYLSIADATYRTRQATEAELPLIPSAGLPSPLASFLLGELRIKKTSRHRDLRIEWKPLERQAFFEMDRDRGRLYLNSLYRRQLLHGLDGSSADLPVVKCLLFFVLEDALSSERTGSKMREKLEQVNRILVEAVRYERSSE